MDIFNRMKNKNFDDLMFFVQHFSPMKGFEDFALQNWNVYDGDYVRAIVTCAYLLNERPANNIHQIHTLDLMFSDSKYSLLEPLKIYFDDSNKSISKAYIEKLQAYEYLNTLKMQLFSLKRDFNQALIQDYNVEDIFKFNNKRMFVSILKLDGSQTESYKKVRFYGSNLGSLKIKIGGIGMRLVNSNSGVTKVIDPDSDKIVYENRLSTNDRLTTIQKIGYTFGYDSAQEFYSNEVKRLCIDADKEYLESKREEGAMNM